VSASAIWSSRARITAVVDLLLSGMVVLGTGVRYLADQAEGASA
jgi:hypothetical protein